MEKKLRTKPPITLTPIPTLSKAAVGRKNELFDLKQCLQKEQITVLINGMGGMGKTTLAKAFLHQEQANYDYLAWVPFEGNLKESIIHAFNDHFQFNGKQEEIYYMIRTELRDFLGKKLIILDNINDFDEAEKIQDAFPNSHILLTSRFELDFISIPLDSLPFHYAKELFLQHCEKKVDESILQELFDLIGYHTLMIEMLSKTYASNPLSLFNLLQLFKEKHFKRDHFKQGHFKGDRLGEEKAVLFYLSTLFESTSLDSNEIFLLQQFSILASTEEFIFSDLIKIFKIKKNKHKDYLVSLERLVKKGWLRQIEENFYCHEMIRAFVLNSSICPFVPDCKNTIAYFSQELENEYEHRVLDKIPLLPHVVSIIKAFSFQSSEIAILSQRLGTSYRLLGQSKTALPYLEQSLKYDLENYGDKHPRVANLWREFGKISDDLGQSQKAIEYYQKALSMDQKNHGDHHPSMMKNWVNLGNTCRILGRHTETLEYQKKALSIALQFYKEDHPSVGECWNDLGLAYKYLGHHKDAIHYLEKALGVFLKYYGDDHPEVAVCLNNLGTTSQDLGSYEKALEYLEKALQIDLKCYGKNHPEVATSWNNLGLVYYFMKQYESAIEYLEKSLKSDLKTYGPDHPKLGVRLSNLGISWMELGEHDKAIEHHEEALRINLKSYGLEHPAVARDRREIGVVLGRKGEFDKSICYLEHALQIYLKTCGKEHTYVARVESKLGDVFKREGKTQKAIEHYEKSASLYLKLFGKNHPEMKQIEKILHSLRTTEGLTLSQ